ncbi:hypothetical protein BDV41DRAFT_560993 [Aspergillus transmontanensis]|uniref:YWTD domain-containing protein n=1 Tax=Aspergillus transmontanensis TaxID=1034304 RepID=A0A5N6WBM3_9EURO|nr:hypothetical protein BDV41DRAFT_560993 [Aspergillus transmontanensis]
MGLDYLRERASEPAPRRSGISLGTTTPTLNGGEIVELTSDGKIRRVLVDNQALPDGIAIDPESKRMFWTCMGTPGKDDGAVYSADLDGSDIQTVVAPGMINTPKQLTLDSAAKKLYFCDREGLRVCRCNFDGTDFTVLIQTGQYKDPQEVNDAKNWCVGVAVAPRLGKFYWTQKGASKGGQGRIFCANIDMPAGQSATSRSDIQCLLNNLPEPIDLEVDETSRTLYWTDRGEIPFGNSLNRVGLDQSGLPLPVDTNLGYEVLCRHLNEAIGLRLDLENGHIYMTDLGGSIYRCNADGTEKKILHSDDLRAFTGISSI